MLSSARPWEDVELSSTWTGDSEEKEWGEKGPKKSRERERLL